MADKALEALGLWALGIAILLTVWALDRKLGPQDNRETCDVSLDIANTFWAVIMSVVLILRTAIHLIFS